MQSVVDSEIHILTEAQLILKQAEGALRHPDPTLSVVLWLLV